MPDYKKEIKFAKETAVKAGAILRKGMNNRRRVNFKGRVDLVTEYDLKSEKFITGEIARVFPHHSILAEEGGETQKQSSYLWIIDPLDGTTNFAHDYPAFCVSIGLEVDGQMVLGTAYDPVQDELFHAVKGKGAFCNKRRIHVSSQIRLNRSLLGTGFPYDIHQNPKRVMKFLRTLLTSSQGIRRGGSAALDLCYVASGRLDGHWEEGLQPWDTAAGALIVKEAGGRLTDYRGNPYTPYVKTIIASNSLLHEAILAALRMNAERNNDVLGRLFTRYPLKKPPSPPYQYPQYGHCSVERNGRA